MKIRPCVLIFLKSNTNPFFPETLDQVLAMFSYTAQNSDELTFYKGSVITVLNREGDWWQGELNGQVGVFPNNYVQPLADLPTTTQCKLMFYLCLICCTFRIQYVAARMWHERSLSQIPFPVRNRHFAIF